MPPFFCNARLAPSLHPPPPPSSPGFCSEHRHELPHPLHPTHLVNACMNNHLGVAFHFWEIAKLHTHTPHDKSARQSDREQFAEPSQKLCAVGAPCTRRDAIGCNAHTHHRMQELVSSAAQHGFPCLQHLHEPPISMRRKPPQQRISRSSQGRWKQTRHNPVI